MHISSLKVFLDYQIVLTVIMVILAYIWGDWRNWKLYYPTILFFIVGDFSYALLTYNYPLWQFESPLLKTTGSDFLISIVFFSATLLIYLPRFPQDRIRQIQYVFLWVFIYTLIEYISILFGFFSHHNGWNIWWSLLFNICMFPLLRLHYKKPPIVWLSSIIIAIATLVYFKVPFSSMK